MTDNSSSRSSEARGVRSTFTPATATVGSPLTRAPNTESPLRQYASRQVASHYTGSTQTLLPPRHLQSNVLHNAAHAQVMLPSNHSLMPVGAYARRSSSIYSTTSPTARHGYTTSSQLLHPQRYTSSQVSATSSLTGASVISERWTEHRIKVPKRIVREDIFEKVVVIPDRRVVEEVIEEEQIVREKIVEVAKPVIREKVVEVAEIECVDKVIEVPEVVIQERLRHVPKVEIVERVQNVPKIIRQEKVVEVPQIQYREVPVVKQIEVPEIREEIVIRQRPVPQYVEKPVAEVVEVRKEVEVPVRVPVAYAAEVVHGYEVPQLEPVVTTQRYPLYVPKFVEVPVARPFVDSFMAEQAARLYNHVALLSNSSNALGMCQLENMATELRQADLVAKLEEQVRRSGKDMLLQKFNAGQLSITEGVPTASHNYTARDRGVARHRSTRRSKKKREKSFLERIGCPTPLLQWQQVTDRTSSSKTYPTKTSNSGVMRSRTGPGATPVSFAGAYPSVTLPRRTQRADSEDLSSTCSSCSACQAELDRLRARSRRAPAGGLRWR